MFSKTDTDELLGVIPHILGFVPRKMIVAARIAFKDDAPTIISARGITFEHSQQSPQVVQHLEVTPHDTMLVIYDADQTMVNAIATHIGAPDQYLNVLLVNETSWLSLCSPIRAVNTLTPDYETKAGARQIVLGSSLSAHPMAGISSQAQQIEIASLIDTRGVSVAEVLPLFYSLPTNEALSSAQWASLVSAMASKDFMARVFLNATPLSPTDAMPWFPIETMLHWGDSSVDTATALSIRDAIVTVANHASDEYAAITYGWAALLTWLCAEDIGQGRMWLNHGLSALARTRGGAGNLDRAEIEEVLDTIDAIYTRARTPGWVMELNAS